MILNPFTTPVYLRKIKIDDDFSTSIFNKIASINGDSWSQLSLIFLKNDHNDKEEREDFEENRELDLKLILNLLLQLNNIKQLNRESKINYSHIEKNLTNTINNYLNNLKISDTKNYFKLNKIFYEIKNNLFNADSKDTNYINISENNLYKETQGNIDNGFISNRKFVFEEKKKLDFKNKVYGLSNKFERNFNDKYLNTVTAFGKSYEGANTVLKYNSHELYDKVENNYEDISVNKTLYNNYRFREDNKIQSLKFLYISRIFNLLNKIDIRKNEIDEEKFNTEIFQILKNKKEYENLFIESKNYLSQLPKLLNENVVSINNNKFILNYLIKHLNTLYKGEFKLIEKNLFQNKILNKSVSEHNSMHLKSYNIFNLKEEYFLGNIRNRVNTYNKYHFDSLKELIQNYYVNNPNSNFTKNVFMKDLISNVNKSFRKSEKIYTNSIYKKEIQNYTKVFSEEKFSNNKTEQNNLFNINVYDNSKDFDFYNKSNLTEGYYLSNIKNTLMTYNKYYLSNLGRVIENYYKNSLQLSFSKNILTNTISILANKDNETNNIQTDYYSQLRINKKEYNFNNNVVNIVEDYINQYLNNIKISSLRNFGNSEIINQIQNYINVYLKEKLLDSKISYTNLLNKSVNEYNNMHLNSYNILDLNVTDYLVKDIKNTIKTYNNYHLNNLKELIENYYLNNINSSFAENIFIKNSISNVNKKFKEPLKIYTNSIYKKESLLVELINNEYYLNTNKPLNINSINSRKILKNIQDNILENIIINKNLHKANNFKNEIQNYTKVFSEEKFSNNKTEQNNLFNINVYENNKHLDFHNKSNLTEGYYLSNIKNTLMTYNKYYLSNLRRVIENYYKNSLQLSFSKNILTNTISNLANKDNETNNIQTGYYNQLRINKKEYNLNNSVVNIVEDYINQYLNNIKISNSRNSGNTEIINQIQNYINSSFTKNIFIKNSISNVNKAFRKYEKIYTNSIYKKESLLVELSNNEYYLNTNKTLNINSINSRKILKNIQDNVLENIIINKNLQKANNFKNEIQNYTKVFSEEKFSNNKTEQNNLFNINVYENSKDLHFQNKSNLTEGYYLSNIKNTLMTYNKYYLSNLRKVIENYYIQTDYYNQLRINKKEYNFNKNVVNIVEDYISQYLNNINSSFAKNIFIKNSISNVNKAFKKSEKIYTNSIYKNEIQNYTKVFSEEKFSNNKTEQNNLFNINVYENSKDLHFHNKSNLKEEYYLSNIKNTLLTYNKDYLSNFERVIENYYKKSLQLSFSKNILTNRISILGNKDNEANNTQTNYYNKLRINKRENNLNNNVVNLVEDYTNQYLHSIKTNTSRNSEKSQITNQIENYYKNNINFSVIKKKNELNINTKNMIAGLTNRRFFTSFNNQLTKLERVFIQNNYSDISTLYDDNHKKELLSRETIFNETNHTKSLFKTLDKQIKFSSKKMNNLIFNTTSAQDIENTLVSKNLDKGKLSEEYKIDANIKYKRQTQFSRDVEDAKELYENTQSYLNEGEINNIINETVEKVVAQKLSLNETTVEAEEEKIDYITKKVLLNVEKTLNYEKRKRGLI